MSAFASVHRSAHYLQATKIMNSLSIQMNISFYANTFNKCVPLYPVSFIISYHEYLDTQELANFQLCRSLPLKLTHIHGLSS